MCAKKTLKNASLHRFITDSNNQLAFEIATKLSKCGQLDYTPLHFFGPSGCGKSHLVRAISEELKKQKVNVVHCFAKSFYLDYVFALKNRNYQKFREEYRNLDAFIIEDIDFLQKKKNTQQELLFIADEFISKNKILITCSQLHPKKLKNFQSALANRLSCGSFVPIHPVSQKTMQSYFARMAKNLHTHIEDDALECIGKNAVDRKLRQKIEKLLVLCSESKKGVSCDLIKKCLASSISQGVDKERIISAVREHYEIPDASIILRKDSPQMYKEARYVAMKLIKELLNVSNQNIAEYFGCGESSVRHAYKKAEKSEFYEKLKKLIGNDV